MRLLLDENVPRQLKQDLTKYEVFTVREKGWNGKLNGELLQLMLAEAFNALITADKHLQHQQNFDNTLFLCWFYIPIGLPTRI